MSEYREGQKAVSKDGKTMLVYSDGFWVKDSAYVPSAGKARTTAEDVKDLTQATETAETERQALRDYAATHAAVLKMGSDPGRGSRYDMMTAEEGGGMWDAVGGLLGTPFRAITPRGRYDGYQHLKTVSAKTALTGSQMMKGASSDKDTAIMRQAGVGPYKTVKENLRVLDKAREDAGLSQARARAKAYWIGKFGSQAAAAPDGTTLADILQMTDRSYYSEFDRREKARKAGTPLPRRPQPLPGRKGPTRIDINGTPVR